MVVFAVATVVAVKNTVFSGVGRPWPRVSKRRIITMNKFNVFDELVFDTKQRLLSFCDYAPKALSHYDSIVEMIKEACPF